MSSCSACAGAPVCCPAHGLICATASTRRNWAKSLILLPLATAFALEFTAPAWTGLLAALFLGERLTVSRIGAIVLGFLGVLVILRPGLETFRPAAFLMLAAAVGFALNSVVTKKLTGDVSTFAILFWMNVMQLPLALLGGDVTSFAKLDASYTLPLIGIAVAGLVSHFCLTNAIAVGRCDDRGTDGFHPHSADRARRLGRVR